MIRVPDERQVHEPPRFLRFAEHRCLEVQSGESTMVYLLTDGADDLLSRRQRRGRLSVASGGEEIASFTVADIHGGRLPVHVRVPSSIPSGRRAPMVATLEVEPSTYLTDSRELRVVPPQPPYVGEEPLTRFEFTRASPITVEIGRRASGEISTNARNDILDRTFNHAIIRANCDIPGVSVAVRGPKDGVAHAEVYAASDLEPDLEGIINVTLDFEDGTAVSTSRPCKIVPTRQHEPRPGNQTAPIPAYQIIRVWRTVPENQSEGVTWDEFPTRWNEDKIGIWEMNGDELYLYVNMDERQFRTERSRLTRRYDDNHTQRLTDRYVAYLAFHLFQLHEQSQSHSTDHSPPQRGETYDAQDVGDSNNKDVYDPDSQTVGRELQRVAATLIQTLRSEAELLRLESDTTE